MAAVPEGVPGGFTVVAAGITGKETAIEGVGAETAIAELVLQFCVTKADGSLQPETVRLSLESGAALDDLTQTLESRAIAAGTRLQYTVRPAEEVEERGGGAGFLRASLTVEAAR